MQRGLTKTFRGKSLNEAGEHSYEWLEEEKKQGKIITNIACRGEDLGENDASWTLTYDMDASKAKS